MSRRKLTPAEEEFQRMLAEAAGSVTVFTRPRKGDGQKPEYDYGCWQCDHSVGRMSNSTKMHTTIAYIPAVQTQNGMPLYLAGFVWNRDDKYWQRENELTEVIETTQWLGTTETYTYSMMPTTVRDQFPQPYVRKLMRFLDEETSAKHINAAFNLVEMIESVEGELISDPWGDAGIISFRTTSPNCAKVGYVEPEDMFYAPTLDLNSIKPRNKTAAKNWLDGGDPLNLRRVEPLKKPKRTNVTKASSKAMKYEAAAEAVAQQINDMAFQVNPWGGGQ